MVIPRKLASLVLPAALAGALTGCYEDNCELRGTCPVLDMVPLDSLDVDCDPDSDLAADGCGVFASAQGSDEDGAGTRYVPVRTINRALEIAAKGHHTVYACAEVFPDPVVMTSDFRIFGGFDCERSWEPIGNEKKTRVRVAPNSPALRVLPGAGVAQIFDMAFETTDAVVSGGSSVAAVLEDGSNTSLVRCEFVAGNGARGDDGQDGSAESPIAKSGPNGIPGTNACVSDGPEGGGVVQTECDDGVWTMGGLGGAGGLESGGAGTDGAPVPAENPAGFGLSGLGESDGAGCTAGVEGADGYAGAHGLGGKGHGFFYVSNGYMGHDGQAGMHGGAGQGGGGGGGARGGVVYCGNKPKGGAAGGSGGAGGCGGRPGLGGTYGGASIGIAMGGAAILQTVAVTISTGDGGDGGAGGMFQVGGFGGFQGLGGHGWGGSSHACSGGQGGRGGQGGYGGGASGGPSLGIAHVKDFGTQDFSIIHQGKGGRGGLGGNPNFFDMAGQDGESADSGWIIGM